MSSLSRVLCIAVCTASCTPYISDPIDLAAYHEVLAARRPDLPDLHEFASKLHTQGQHQYNPSDGISLPEAESIALFLNPDLHAVRLTAKVPLLEAGEASRWRDPVFSLDAERILEGIGTPWVVGGIMQITLPVSGALTLEKRRLLLTHRAELLGAYAAERALIVELREAWLRRSIALHQRSVTESFVERLTSIHAVSERLRDAGEILPSESRLFAIERARLNDRLAALSQEVRDLELRIRRFLGFSPAAEFILIPDLCETAPPAGDSFPPDLLAALADYHALEATLRAEIRRQYPDLSIGGGAGSDEGRSRALFSVNVPLPFFDRNQRAIVSTRAQRAAKKARTHAKYETYVSDLSRATQAYQAARSRYDDLTRTLIPLADDQIREAEALARAGELTSLMLLESSRGAFEAKLHLLDAALARGLAAIQLRALTEPLYEREGI
jgi:outer membrane protein, heavy metal efflux system